VIRRNGTYFLNLYRLLVSLEELLAMAPTDPERVPDAQPAGLGAMAVRPSFADLLGGRAQLIVDAKRISENLGFVTHDAVELGLEATAERITHIKTYIAQQSVVNFMGDVHLQHDVRVLKETLVDELNRRSIFVPEVEKYRKYFNKSFGEEVDRAFPEARRDTASAANSYIYDEPTACVFHCMRTAEYGLRGLAKVIAPRLKAEKLEWGAIIRELRRKIEEQHQPGKKRVTPNRKKRLDFYSDALDQCVYFKSIRDDTMHPRPVRYESADALKALTHIEEFMRLLAKNGIKVIPKIAGLSS
jgi:hypothetical protein